VVHPLQKEKPPKPRTKRTNIKEKEPIKRIKSSKLIFVYKNTKIEMNFIY
jgi:hypothetical protein